MASFPGNWISCLGGYDTSRVRVAVVALLSVLAIASASVASSAEVAAPAYSSDDPYERLGTDLSHFFTLARTAMHGLFRAEQWVSREMPEISPAGTGHYVWVFYDGEREVLRRHTEMIALNVTPHTGQDLTGDGRPEIVLEGWTGGANCCNWTEIYGVPLAADTSEAGSSPPDHSMATVLLDMPAGNCGGQLEDLDGDGRYEVVSCDSMFARTFCSFAFSPFPPVVYGLGDDGRYRLDTVKYARYLPEPGAWKSKEEREAEPPLAPTRDPQAKCDILSPALNLVYTGHHKEGFALLEENYRAPDAVEFIEQVRAALEQSELWQR